MFSNHKKCLAFVIVWAMLEVICKAEIYELSSQWIMMCPQIYLNVFTSFAPNGNESAGIYSEEPKIYTLNHCIENCCNDELCNVVFMHDKTCYQIQCNKSHVELCLPLYRPEPKFSQRVKMVLVRPVSPEETWSDLLEASDARQKETLLEGSESQYPSTLGLHECEVGLIIQCQLDEVCVPISKHSRNGLCQCKDGYRRNGTGYCIPHIVSSKTNNSRPGTFMSNGEIPTLASLEPTKLYSEPGQGGILDLVESSSARPLKQLVVSALSKQVRLPENEVTLSAYTVPAEQPGEHYNYVWTLVSQPDGGSSGTMNDQNGGTLKLSHLIEGQYMFKVGVSTPVAHGETFANVTVLPPKRINQPPVALISPRSQVVKLPNTGAVLDGSTSKDDVKIMGWHWELQQGPLGYQPHLVDTPTLQLDNLLLPGNYTFKLTVEDSDHATNSTTANITVLKVTDYPPEANAGPDIIVYLPRNNLTLNGNLSTDDRGIANWEWTKSPSDQDKAVDMQNTRTPYLQLSNLEEGMYTFVLKVTDTSSQSSSAEVHVFVKPPTNNPPVASAGSNLTVALPQTWAPLDGSQSSDDIKIVGWHWQQLSGPSKVSFSAQNNSVTNVTDLTKGQYELQLTVTDDNGNKAVASVLITVTQNKNAQPKANGGGDQTVVLPVSVVVLNGSGSSDDLGIVRWEWSREASSLALSKVVGDSDRSPVFMFTDIVPGRYLFRLRVTDEQGAFDEDTVSIIVKPDPHLYHLVELTLNIEGRMLTQSQEASLEMKLSLLLRDEATIIMHDLRLEDRTGRVVLVFYVEQRGGKAMPGPAVVARLREKLTQDSGLLEFSVANIQTAVCQNNCSGHGVCEQSTRQCLCEAFWMQNLIVKHLGSGDSNCDWSILYVVIVLFTGMLLLVGVAWGVACLCQRAFSRRPRKRQRYSLLDDGEDDAMIPRVPHGKILMSDSDSESDVLYESRKCKMNGDARNGHNKLRNGFAKMGRRIKT